MQMLAIAHLRAILDYCPSTGVLTWKRRAPSSFSCAEKERQRVSSRWNLLRAGAPAGCITSKGYRVLCIEGRNYPAHRIAWAIVHGAWPADEIDHINHARDDNRIVNLREASRAENCQNRSLPKNNSSGQIGVHFHTGSGLWVARAMVGGRRQHMGAFTLRDAAVACRKAANSSLGFHPNHGAL
jgi:hypothetical protein